MIYLLNKIDEQLIANIKAELSRRNWRPAELARRTGFTPVKVGRILNEAQWDSDVLSRLADVFECSPAALLGEIVLPNPNSALLNRVALFDSLPKLDDNDVPLILEAVRAAIQSRSESDPVKKNKNSS